jgi:uncharacterized protein YndB with AHSA1/START domain
MQTAVMKSYIHAPASRVWEAITDHAGLARFSGVRSARLLRSGREHPNGAGAKREVFLGRLRFVEDIVRFEPPHVMEYRVVECSVPFDHELGRIELIERGRGTEVHWTTRFQIAIPGIGSILTKAARPMVCDGFHAMLLELKNELEADAPN